MSGVVVKAHRVGRDQVTQDSFRDVPGTEDVCHSTRFIDDTMQGIPAVDLRDVEVAEVPSAVRVWFHVSVSVYVEELNLRFKQCKRDAFHNDIA